MEVRAITKTVRISAFKARNVARNIQGMGVNDALDVLRFSPQKAAQLIRKTLKSAIANAENNNGLSAESLMIKEATIGEGPTFRRFSPRARGSANVIRKRTSHIRIIVAERTEESAKPARKPRKAKAEGATEAPAKTRTRITKKEKE